MPVYVLCQKTLGNDYMKPRLLTRHLERVIQNSKAKNDFVCLLLVGLIITQLTYSTKTAD